jgi:alkylation response protein AidB-like acyl-CoA dehydrogenase
MTVRSTPLYAPPLRDIDRAADFVTAATIDGLDDALREFGRFASEVIAPSDAIGDVVGAQLDSRGDVTVPPEVEKAYRQYVEIGWAGAAQPLCLGGGGLGRVAGVALQEMFASANLALSLNPMLTQGGIDLLTRWGTDEQKARYVDRLVSGEWASTMNLTESDAGSDVGELRTRAVPVGGGWWRLSGVKIFITWGDHDLTSNIVHLVLARTPGSPPGTRGISLFAVPKLLADGSRNTVRCVRVERKLGIHASPTCVMEFDGALGELIGEEHGGMRAMFTMMNAARLAIGVQGLAIGERATQQSWRYAAERRQGRAHGASDGPSPINAHPDVRRMLLDLRSSTRAMRLLLYTTAAHADAADDAAGSPTARAAAQRRVDVLTPVVKAWCTDTGFRLASLAVQIHGGTGYVEETGVAQLLRDSRIGPIYEGTNGIQAIDLAVRKVARDSGSAIAEHLDDLDQRLLRVGSRAELADVVEVLREGIDAARRGTAFLVAVAHDHERDVLAGATAYLNLIAVVTAGVLLADLADRHPDDGDSAIDARFFAFEHVVLSDGLVRRLTAGAERLGMVS